MDKKLEKILNDLYKLDSSLSQYEKEIINIIEECMKAKPDTKFNKDFVLELRQRLMEKIEIDKQEEKNTLPRIKFDFNFIFAGAGLTVVLIMIISLPFLLKSRGYNGLNKLAVNEEINMDNGIKHMSDSAFGKILSSPNNTGSSFGSLRESAALGMGGGGSAPMAANDASISSSKIAPEYINYKYVYKGEDFSIDRDRMNVYKKGRDSSGGKIMANYLSNLKFNLINLKMFNDASMQNLTLTQDREFGYMVSINFQDTSIDISSNWNEWPHPETKCRDEACYQANRLKMEDVPDDEKILKIAGQFIKDYSIDISHYGQPIVQNGWKKSYEQFEDKNNFWVPEEMTVIYPLIIDEQNVYDEGGSPTGLFVGVNIRYNRVATVRPIAPYNYESSSYEMITDKDKIIELAENGGIYPAYRVENSSKTIEIELGTPKLGLTNFWNYNQDTGAGDQLYMPAMIFPVQKAGDEGGRNIFYQDYIAIPLAKEIVDKMQTISPPMPLLEGDVRAQISEPALPKN